MCSDSRLGTPDNGAANEGSRILNFTITEKRRSLPGRAFALLKSPTIAFTLKNLLKDTMLNLKLELTHAMIVRKGYSIVSYRFASSRF